MDKKGKIALIGALFLVGVLVISLVLAQQDACNDKIDNDGDGYCDYRGCGSIPADPGCYSRHDNSELDPAVECDDGSDNDGDNDIDYNDAGCSGPTDTDESNCGDSICEGAEVCDVCVADCGYCNSCADSDGGIVPTVFGNVSGMLNDQFYVNFDFCLTNATVSEYYCSGDYAQNTNISCSGNTSFCSSGRCI